MPERMAPTLREMDRLCFKVAGNAMGPPDIPNRCTKVYFLSLRRCRQHEVYFGAANLCSKPLLFSTQSCIFLLCSIASLFRLQSSKTACIGTESGLGQLPELRSTRGGVAGLEQRGVEQREIPRGRCRLGAVGGQVRPSGAAAAPL